MKRLLTFLNITTIGGIAVILPLLLFWFVLVEVAHLLIRFATPLADLTLPPQYVANPNFHLLLALVLLGGLSFAVGLALRSAAVRSCGRWIRLNLLDRLPVYPVLRRLVHSFAGLQAATSLRPALLTLNPDWREMAYVVEDHGNGLMTVLVPSAPAPLSGSLKLVSAEKVEVLGVPFLDFVRVVSEWGVGLQDLLRESRTRTGIPVLPLRVPPTNRDNSP